eukprot:TRINITY_DN8617_c0_g1_i2.p1 TRINITY_DN8617_c0_g1~~TRINITY_DN8617_c0_g1_i2.p1  ORF type:complete len:159 (-),score=71.09 TRINITY_DN8617_c0_g1_i2:10-486(-)
MDEDMRAALEASELEAALKMSMNKSPEQKKIKTEALSPPSLTEEEELAAAIRLSHQAQVESMVQVEKNSQIEVQDEPDPKDPNATLIVIRLLDGTRLQRRFSMDCKIGQVVNFLKTTGFDPNELKLTTVFPPKEYVNFDETLKEAGLHPSASMVVRKR